MLWTPKRFDLFYSIFEVISFGILLQAYKGMLWDIQLINLIFRYDIRMLHIILYLFDNFAILFLF